MHLIPCPACGREISTQAAACPQCGHPNESSPPAKDEPACYRCSKPSTTRCQNCNVRSCSLHLYNCWNYYSNYYGAYEQVCSDCLRSAVRAQRILYAIAAVLIGGLVLFIAYQKMSGR